MLKDLKDIINKDTLLDGVWFSEDEPIFGRGSDIIEQAKHSIVYAVAFEPDGAFADKMVDITMFIDLIKDIEDGGHEDDYVKVQYSPMGAFVISDAMGGENE